MQSDSPMGKNVFQVDSNNKNWGKAQTSFDEILEHNE